MAVAPEKVYQAVKSGRVKVDQLNDESKQALKGYLQAKKSGTTPTPAPAISAPEPKKANLSGVFGGYDTPMDYLDNTFLGSLFGQASEKAGKTAGLINDPIRTPSSGNKTADRIAQGTGSLLGLLAPGPGGIAAPARGLFEAGEKLGATVAPKIAAKVTPKAAKAVTTAVRGGASFGAYGTGEALAQGDPIPQALKQGAISTGLGAGLGLGGLAVGKGIQAGASKLMPKKADPRDMLAEVNKAFATGKATGETAKINPLAELKLSKTQAAPTKQVTGKVKKAIGGKKERQFAQNVMDSKVATSEIKQNLKVNKLTYEPITNKETFDKATELVKKDSNKALEYFNSPSAGISADDVALGEALITKSIRDGNTNEANRLIADLAEKLTTAGQAVQAASIFKRLTPEGMLLYAQRVVNGAKKDALDWFGKKAPKIELTPEDSKFILDNMAKFKKLPDGREKDVLLGQIMQLIADKAPVRTSDKIKGLQRISLLLNPKTMVRNTLGNTVFGAVDNISNVVGTPIDILTSKITGNRTTTLPSLTGQLKSGFKGVKETIQDAKLGIDTYAGKTQYELPSSRVFKTGGLNALDRATKVGLQLGDRPFYQAAYDDVLRQQMKLAKTTKPTQEMIEQAHQIAQQRTYQDTNALTEAFKKAQSALNKVSSAVGVGSDNFGLGNIVLPFIKTPANILKRAIEYSPIGIQGAIREASKAGKGQFNQRAFVDSISRSVTGTALIMVGYDLAKKGMITGSANKDKDIAAFERDLGKEDYAWKIGNKFYTYDWAQPASMALAIGADVFIKGKDRKEAESVVFDAVRSGGETLFKQSLLQGVQRFMGGYSPIENIANTTVNAPTQAIPTFLNQLGQLTDPTQRSTYSPTLLGKGANLVKARLPIANRTLEPKINTFGQTVERNQGNNTIPNIFLNPGKMTDYKPTKVQSEIIRIYESTGDKDVFPKIAPRYFTYKGERIELTTKEITSFQRTMGQKAEKRIKQITDSKASDKAKAEYLKKIIDASYEEAKKELLRNRKK